MASSFVQSKVGPLTFTWDSGPTEGNLMVAGLMGRSGQSHDETDRPVLTDGWTFRAKYENTDATYRRTLYVFSKVAGASESSTVTATWTSGSGTETFAGVELSGIDGSYLSSDVTNSGNAASTSYSTGSIAGSGNRVGICVFGWKHDGNNGGAGSFTYDNYTKDLDSAIGDGGTYVCTLGFGRLDYTGSTSISETGSVGATNSSNTGNMAILLAWDRDAAGATGANTLTLLGVG